MKSTDLRLFEFAPSRTAFNQILNDASLKMGFECEMITDQTAQEGTEPEEPPDYDNWDWDDIKTAMRLGSRTHARIRDGFDNWMDDRVREELDDLWKNDNGYYIVQWCIDNGHLESADDENAYEVLRKYRDDAHEAFNEEFNDEARSDVDADMDDYISDAFSSVTGFFDHFGIEYETESEEEAEDEVSEETVYRDMAHSLRHIVGRIKTGETSHKQPNYWYIEPDGSLESDENYITAEVVSAVYPVSEGLVMLKKIFDWMKQQYFTTNTTTGLHVSFSIDGMQAEDYDFLKMMVLFDENYTANLFDRLGEYYCKQMRDVLFGALTKLDAVSVMSERQLQATILKLRQVTRSIKAESGETMGISKYYTFRHRSNGVIEFRSMGGEDYEQKYDLIRKRIVNMAYLMKVGSDPHLMAREYISAVYKMLTGIKYQKPELGSGTGRIESPFALSAFRTLFDRNPTIAKTANTSPMDFVRIIASQLASKEIILTPLQLRQLRFFMAKHKITGDTLRANNYGDDASYNALANIMRWPLVVPGDHDERQQAFPFARTGRDLSGTSAPVAEPEETSIDRFNRRQPNIGY